MSVSQDGEVGFETLDPELVGEPEDEFEDEFLGELLPESTLSQGEFEDEFEFEDEYEDEDEYEVLGGGSAGGALGQGEFEDEQFLPLGALAAPLAQAAIPMAVDAARSVAQSAVPAIGRMLGGFFGGSGKRRRRRRREGESEYELAYELAASVKSPAAPMSRNEAMAQTMAAAAARTPSDHQAEALMGAATVMMMTPREQALLQSAIPDLIPRLVQVNAVLTDIARRRKGTRAATTVELSGITAPVVKTLAQRVEAGAPVSERTVDRVVQMQAKRALVKPAVARTAALRNQRGVRQYLQQTASRHGA